MYVVSGMFTWEVVFLELQEHEHSAHSRCSIKAMTTLNIIPKSAALYILVNPPPPDFPPFINRDVSTSLDVWISIDKHPSGLLAPQGLTTEDSLWPGLGHMSISEVHQWDVLNGRFWS